MPCRFGFADSRDLVLRRHSSPIKQFKKKINIHSFFFLGGGGLPFFSALLGLVFTGFTCFFFLGFTEFNWVSLRFTRFYWVLLGFVRFYWVSRGFIGFYWVL